MTASPDKLAAAAEALAAATAARATARATATTAGRPTAARAAAAPAARAAAAPAAGAAAAAASRPPPDPARRDAEADPHEVARTIVLRALTAAPRSRAQLEEALCKRNCSDEVARQVLDRMSEVGLVDDTAYAQLLVRSQQAGRGLARRALARELRSKGIDKETAEATLEQVDPAQERDRARQLVAKKLKTLHGLDVAVQTRRLAGMLARKGYPSSLAFAVVREAVADAPEHQRD